MMSTKNIWVLLDDRAGHRAQALGVAQALGETFVEKELHYTSLAQLPNFLKINGLWGLSAESCAQLKAPWPDLVIAAGRKTVPIAQHIKKQSQAKLVQIMDPGARCRSAFDLICLPSHDLDGAEKADNILEIKGAPHLVTDEKLNEARNVWLERFSHLKLKKIALMVGGATKNRKFDDQMAAQLGQEINEQAKAQDASLLVTTSRRTGPQADILIHAIGSDAFTFKWGDEGDNPYMGFLACADIIVVSGDSVSMCSEACATGKPVYIYAPEDMISPKHMRMAQSLVDGGYARFFDGDLQDFEPKKLESTQHIAHEIKTRFF
jgi:mitochondrial fission protein ELM1